MTCTGTGGGWDSAIAYNCARPYTPAMWRAVQALVGVTADGIPGEQTARAVASWQMEAGQASDGKCGPLTLAAMELGPLRFFGDGFTWVGDGSICADGATCALNPTDTGIEYMSNSASAIIRDAAGNRIVQGPRDPHPNHYVVGTAMVRSGYPDGHHNRYVDARAVPYLVLPGNIGDLLPKSQRDALRKGDGAAIERAGHSTRAIYAEVGPAWTLDPGHLHGELSIKAAEALDHDPYQLRSGVWRASRGISSGVTYRVYTGTRGRCAVVDGPCGQVLEFDDSGI